jgi:predicted dehydrogenase
MIKTVLIGLGSIGGDKPEAVDSPGGPALTHLHAIVESDCFSLHGVVDLDTAKCNKLLGKWNLRNKVKISDHVYGIAGNRDVQFVVIAVPAEYQDEIFSTCLSAFPNCKDYLIEKPVGSNRIQYESILALSKGAGVNVYVNFQRFYYEQYSRSFVKQNIGTVHSAECIYTRGFVRDGSHAMAFFSNLFGNVKDFAFVLRNGLDDYSNSDKTYTVAMQFDDCDHVVLRAMDGRVADIFEIDLIGEKGRLQYTDHGRKITVYKHKEETYFTDAQYNSVSEFPYSMKYLALDLKQVYSNIAVLYDSGLKNNDLYLCKDYWDIKECIDEY